jgi:hypothetical protein
LTLYLVLGGWLVVGTLIINLSTFIPAPWVITREIAHDAGIAIYSAVVLGLSVHLWLESRVVRDVFRAAVGHILPPELRDEVNWISSFTCLTQRAVTTLDIEHLGEGVVKLTIEREAEIVNFTTKYQRVQPLLAIDDWGIPGKNPEIIEFEYIRGNDDPVRFTGTPERHPDRTIQIHMSEVDLEPNQHLRLFTKFVEYTRDNARCIQISRYPIIRPELNIRSISPSLNYFPEFGHDANTKTIQLGRRHILQGTLMPHQRMGARWFPKTNGEAAPESND